jgi:mRNA-degrading endonuclease toxin of MazEF toxin-antitoxin module
VSSTRRPELGSVVWAELEDANGYRKVRPVVVVTPSAEIAAGKPVRVVAVTTRLPNPLPNDHVLLPWDRQGKSRSGMRRRCAAIASWQAEIPVSDVQEVVGILPPAVIVDLLDKIAAGTSPPSATPVPQPGGPEARRSGSPTSTRPPAADADEEQGNDEIARADSERDDRT